MGHYYLYPGQNLWYCNRDTGELGTVKVEYVYPGEFVIRYHRRNYRLPYSALGTRLFFTRKGAACPSEIIERWKAREGEPIVTGHDGQYFEEYEPFDDDWDHWKKNYYDYSHRDSGDSVKEPIKELFGVEIDKN